jgi:hypothetical protein
LEKEKGRDCEALETMVETNPSECKKEMTIVKKHRMQETAKMEARKSQPCS